MRYLFTWRGGILRQFWSAFAVVLVFNQLAILGGLYLFLFKPAVASFSTLVSALVDAAYREQHVVSATGLNVISDHWISNDHIVVVQGEIHELEAIPPYPGLRMIARGVERQLGNEVRVGFKSGPEKMLWIQYGAQKPFAVGVPMSERLHGFKLLAVVIALTFLMSGFAAWLIAAHLTRPLAHLSETARRVGRGENIGQISVRSSAPAEVTGLATALNQMREEIEQMLAERERFLAGIAHDLRTPLSRMRVALELGDVRDSELNDGLRDDIEEMRTILEQFIELSRLDTEQSEPTEIGNLNSAVADISSKYERAGETLFVHAGDLPALRFKPVALKRLLYNLVDNALRYGQGGVVVRTDITISGQVCLSVTNVQSDSIRDSALVKALRWAANGQQSGLGLAIVRRLAEVHEAEVRIITEPGGGRQVQLLFKTAL